MPTAVATRRHPASVTRRKLWCGTALALCMSAAGPAWGQTLPNLSNAGGATVTTDTTAGTMSVDINGANRVVTYSSFNLGTPTSSSETLTFLNSGAAGSYSVLNRVNGGSGSTIYGSISAPSDITVWIVDRQGVTFGPTGSFSGGGLVVSTAQLNGADETAFLAGTLNTLGGASNKPIIFQTGSGAISASGSIVVVGQGVSVDKTLTSSNGAVVLVAATDVSFTDINSPLSFTVSQGTTLTTGVAVGATGSLSGQSIALAGGVDNAVTAALLQVDSGASLTATAVGGSIVLATDTTGGITIANSSGETPGINSAGTLNATGANADITVTGSGPVTLAGALTAGRNIVLSATDATAGNVTVAGSVATGSDYQIDARDITLGANATTSTQQAGGAIRINAARNASGRGNLTVQSNTDATGAEAVRIDAATGAIDFDDTTSLIGGTAGQRADVVLASSSDITAGSITARSLLDSGSLTDLNAPGNVTLGNVATDTALRITSAGGSIATGNLVSNTGGVRLDAQAAGDVVSTGVTAAGDIALLARDNIRLASALSTGGGISLTATTGDISGIQLGAPAGDGRPLVNFGRANLTAGTEGETIAVSAIAGTAQLGTLSAGSGTSDLGANQIIVTAQAIDLSAATAINGHVDLEGTGAVRAGTLSAGTGSTLSDVIVNTTGTATVDGTVTANRDYLVTGSAVTLGGTAPVTQSAKGAVTIRANSGAVNGTGSLTLQSNSDGLGAETLYLNAVAGAVDLASGSQLLGGLSAGTAAQRSDVLITSAPTVRLGNVTGTSLRSFGNPTVLTATGAVTTGDVTVDQALGISSATGSVTTDDIESLTGGVSLQAGSSILAGTVKARNTIDMLATNDIRLVSGESTLGSITLNALTGLVGGPGLGKADLTANGAGQIIRVAATGSASLGSLSAGSGGAPLGFDQILVTGGSIDLDSATAVNGNVHLVTSLGALRAGSLTAGTPTILADVVVDSAGAATVDGAVSASRNYSVSGTSATLGDAGGGAVTQSAGGTLTVSATGGDVLGRSGLTLQSDGDVTVGASAAATIRGAVTAAGNYSVSGASVALGGSAPATQSAGGLLTLTATGDIGSAAGLTLQSDGNVTVNTAGTIDLQGPVSALGNYSVTGGSVSLGSAVTPTIQSAGSLLSVTATGGNVLGRAGLTLQSGLDTTIGATGSATIQGAVSASRNYSVTGASVSLGDPGGGTVTQSAGGLLGITATAGDVTGLAGLTLQSGSNLTVGASGAVTLAGPVSAGGTYSVSATGITLGDAGATAVTQSAGGPISIIATTGGVLGNAGLTLQSNSDVTVSAGSAVTLRGAVSALGNYGVTGTSVTLGGGGPAVQSATGTLTVTATGGDVTGLAGLSLQSDLDVTVGATGTAALAGPVSAQGNYSVAGASVTLGDAGGSAAVQSAGGLLTVIANSGDATSLSGLSLQSGSDLNVSASGTAAIAGPVSATGNYIVSATAATLGSATPVTQSAGGFISVAAYGGDATGLAGLTLQSGSDMFVGANGNVSVAGPVSAAGSYTTYGYTVTLGSGAPATQSAGGPVSITATLGDAVSLAGLTLQSGSDVLVNAAGTASLAGPVSAVGNYTVSGTAVTLGSGSPATQSAGGVVSLTATGGDVTGLAGLSLESGSDLTVSATGAASLAGGVSAVGNYTISGTAVTLGSDEPSTQSAGGFISVSATGGAVTGLAGLTLQSGGDLTVNASGEVTLAGAASAVGDYSVTGTGVTLGSGGPAVQSAGGSISVNATGGDILGRPGLSLVSGGDTVASATGAVTLAGSVTAGGGFGVSGTSVTLGDAAGNVTQSARGIVIISASGGITGLGGLTLQSNSDGVGSELLALNAGGMVNFAPSTTLLGGPVGGPHSDILIGSAPSLALGSVIGRSLHSISDPSDLVATGSITLGNVTVDQALTVRTAGGSIATGDLTVLGAGQALRLSGGGGASDLATGTLQTDGGDIILSAGRDVIAGAIRTAPTGDPTAGTIAILAGRNLDALSLAAGEDIALSAGAPLALGAVRTGDDIDISTSGMMSLVSAVSTGTGSDGRAVQFDRTLAGQPASIAFAGAAGQTGHNITIRAAGLTSPTPLSGEAGTGLVVRGLTGATDATLAADQGDIRIGTLGASGNVDVTASQGSVSGLDSSWTGAPVSGGTTLQAPGAIVLEGVGAADFVIGSATAATISTGAGTPANLRLGTVRAGSLALTAGSNLQIDDAQITGTASLHTLGGSAGAFNLTAPSLVDGHGRADLSGADLTVTAARAAQLGTLSANGQIEVTAAAIDVSQATAALGSLSLLATSGRLALGDGSAGADAILIKEDADIGSPKTAADNLLTAGTVTAGGTAAFRSATSATIGAATATGGDLTVNARDDASLGTGNANAGAIRLLAGRNATATALSAEDIAVRAGNDADLGTLVAEDNLDLQAGAALTVVSGSTLGAGTDNRSFVLDPALAGTDAAITLGASPAADGDIRLAGGSVTLGQLDSAIGNIAITASTGDVTGLPGNGAVAVHGAGKSISVTASAGNVRLGPLSAGQGSSTLVGTQIDITAQVIDLLSATATNGGLSLTATDGSLTLGTGTAGGGATLVKQGTAGDLTVDSLTATQDITVQSATSAQLGTLQSTSGALALTATNGSLALDTGIAGGGATLVKQGATGDLTVGSLTAGQGITVQSSTSAQLGTLQSTSGALALTASSGSLTLEAGTAGGGATLVKQGATGDLIVGSLTAGQGITVQSATSAQLGTLRSTNGALALTATGGDLTLDSGTAGAGATLLKQGPAGALTVNSLTAAQDVTIRSDTSAQLGTLQSANGTLALTASNGSLALDTGIAGGGATLVKQGAAGDLAIGSLTATQGITVQSDTSAQLGTLRSTSGTLAITATNGSLSLDTGTAGGSATLLKQGTTGDLTVGSLTAAQDIALQSQTNARIGTLRSSNGSLAVLAQGEATGLDPAGAGLALDAFEDGAVSAGDMVRIGAARAGDDLSIETPGAVELVSAIADGSVGDGRAIRFDRTRIGQSGGIAFDSPPAITPMATGSNITIRAASLGGPAMTGDTDTGLVIGTLDGGSVSLTSPQGDIRADKLTASSGDIKATAPNGSVTGRRTGFQSATGGSTISAKGQLILDVAGDVAAGSVTAGTFSNTGQTVPASIRLGRVNADTLALTAANGLQIDSATVSGAVTLGIDGGTANPNVSGYGVSAMTAGTGKAIAVEARNAAQLGALQGGPITVKADAVRIGSARATGGDVSIESRTALALVGAIETDSSHAVTLTNNGTGGTIIGDAATGGGTDMVLDNAVLSQIATGNLVIDSKGRPVTIGKLTIGGNTGTSSFRILSTGAIVLNDAISGSGTGTLQIGGASTADPSGLVDPAQLATEISANIGESGTRAAILLPNGTVDLRARRIVFGRTALVDRYLPAGGTPPSDASVALDVANAASLLYTSDGTGRQFLTAKRLKVSYANFALFQNTGGPNGAGVALNDTTPPSVATLALQLFGPGDATTNSFALFGTVNGFIGRAAGILPNEIIEIWSPGGNPRVVRISQGNARLNGCVIGSPDKGCLVNDPPRPNFSIYDQRQTQLFGMADDPLLFFNPLVGRGNEGLIVDIADAPVGIDTIECDPSKGPCSPGEPR